MTDSVAPAHVLHLGDCVEVLRDFPDASVDAVVSDPPYELGFMGKGWDASGIAYNIDLWSDVLRVLKPGGHLLAFGGTRTYHRLACAIEDAGFEIRDSIHWVYGSGFPKSLDVSKAIDKAAGAERKVVGVRVYADGHVQNSTELKPPIGTFAPTQDDRLETAPATDDAARWQGWGTALKPAHEPIVVARKPLAGTVAQTVLAHGTGALNIDGCRVGTTDDLKPTKYPAGRAMAPGGGKRNTPEVVITPHDAGRWPPNFLLTHAEGCEEAGTTTVKASGAYPAQRGEGVATGFGKGQPDPRGPRRSGNGDGTETIAVWNCVEGCPVREMDAQSGRAGAAAPASGPTYSGPSKSGSMAGAFAGLGDKPPVFHNDTGGASRFFPAFRYQAKASRRERGEGNTHPTVKPVELMRWLVRLVTPPGGVVLDPFTGSGTTGVAAVLEGFDFIGIEREPEYAEIAERRISWWAQSVKPTLFQEGE